jgi:CHAT domain-containing protein
MKYLPFILCIHLTSIAASGQGWLENTLKKAEKKVTEKIIEMPESSKARLDSLDFQFAMSINEGSNLFDVAQKGEKFTKVGSLAINKTLDTEKIPTSNDRARMKLDSSIYLYEGRLYDFAEDAFNHAKSYMEENSLTESLTYLRCLSSLGVMFMVQGRNEEAQKFIAQSLAKSDSVLGKKSAGYASNLNSFAKLNQLQGKYNEAEQQFDEALSIVQKIFGEESMQYAIVLNNKAMLYQAMGRNADGLELMKKAVASAESAPKKLANKSFDSRKFQLNQALMYQLNGNLVEAEAAFISIKKVFESNMQVNNPEYASLLNQLGLLYIQMNKPEQVEPLLKKSLDVYKRKFGEENISYAKVQNDLGNFYRMQARFADSEAALKRAVDIRKNVLGESHPDYVKSIENLGILYWKKGDVAAAYPLLKEAADKSLDFISHYFPPMSEAEKTKYWDVLHPRFQRFYNYAMEASANNPELLKVIFDYQIATKALLLSSTNKIKKSILESSDQALIAEYTSWLTQKENLSRYYSLSKEDLQRMKIDIAELENAANATERSLSKKSSAFSQAFAAERITLPQVKAQLNDLEALVEVIRVRAFDKDFTADSRYVVLVVSKSAPQPKMVVLENGAQLETRYAKYYKNSIQQKTPDEFSYDQYWAKIEPLLTGKKTIYLSPDGVYNQINVNTLKKKDGDFVINRFEVVIIGNSKDLISIKQRKPTVAKKNAFILGFPDYAGAAVPLPGTKVEIDAINKILTVAGFKTSLKQGAEASETNFKTAKGPQLMHIATHGYFLADSDLQGGDALGVNGESAKNNPLLRSGLILAGAKSKENNDVNLTANDNGILTAYEAMNLDLVGTDLIVMSACETGLGDVKSGEGVYGLQRAFLVAGANAMIMSLWKVDDAATQQLMTNFYTNWTKSGNKLKAFKQAQQQLMLKYKEPYYWGAFVMMGM